MIDFKELFENAVQIPVADTAFDEEQNLPYAAFIDDVDGDGDDFHTFLLEHNLTVELYSERISPELEKRFEICFESQSWKWSRHRIYIASEYMFETIYQIQNFMERK